MYDVAAFGNPLLDITVKSDDYILKKYNLKDDDQTDIPAAEMGLLYSDIKKYSSTQSAGGCAQNTLRVLQWLIQEPNKTIIFGGIGNDEQGRILTKLVEMSGVKTKYLVHENETTGICIALTSGYKRSLVAHLGAAEIYPIEAVTNNCLNILKSVKICYLEAFFLSKKLEVAHYIKELCSSNKSVLAFNLCGSYICKMYPEDIINFAENCDILFGNRAEYIALGDILHIDDPINVAIQLQKSYKRNEINNNLLRYGKIIVITDGSNNVNCILKDADVQEFPVEPISIDNIKDTIAAGDSFVGGFLAGLLMGYELQNCVKLANWTAGQIIQQIGCTIPNFLPDIETIL